MLHGWFAMTSGALWNWERGGRRLLLAGYVTLGMFLFAHLMNGFLADSLYVLPKRGTQATAAPLPMLSARNVEDLKRDILSSGAFPVDKQWSEPAGVGPVREGFPVTVPLNVRARFSLVGTVMTDGEGLLAVLEDLSTKRQGLYRLHEQIPGGGIVSRIERERVLFRLERQQEWLERYPAHPVSPVAGDAAPDVAEESQSHRRFINRREIILATANLPRLLAQARAVPAYVDGKLDGFRIETIEAHSFFEKVGLRVGDVVRRVNGTEIRDPGTILTLFNQLRNERFVQLDVLREQYRTTLTYEIR